MDSIDMYEDEINMMGWQELSVDEYKNKIDTFIIYLYSFLFVVFNFLLVHVL